MTPSAESAHTWKVQLGWLVLFAVVAAPAVFLFLVTPKQPTEKPTTHLSKSSPATRSIAGLGVNPDWDGMPEIFAVWSEKAHWENDRTRFAYWHPGSRTYGYFSRCTERRKRTVSKKSTNRMTKILSGTPVLPKVVRCGYICL